jgi:WD40 repeat protein
MSRSVRLVRRFGEGTLHGVARSTDGRIVVATSIGVRSCDPRTLALSDVLELGIPGPIVAASWSSRGELAVIEERPYGTRHLHVVDPARPGVLRTVLADESRHGTLIGPAWSPDGTRLATGGLGSFLRAWDAASGEVLCRGDGAGAVSLAFSPDGAQLAVGAADERLQLWTLGATPKVAELRSRGRATAWVDAVAFSPDGTRLAGACRGDVGLWDAASGRRVASIAIGAKDAWVRGLAFSPDGGRLAISDMRGTLQLWDVAAGQPVVEVPTRAEVLGFVDGGLLTRDPLALWDVASGEQLASRTWDERGVASCVGFDDVDGHDRIVALVDQGYGKPQRMRTWDIASGELVREREERSYRVSQSPDRRWLVTRGMGVTVRAADGSGVPTVLPAPGLLSRAWFADGLLFAAGAVDTDQGGDFSPVYDVGTVLFAWEWPGLAPLAPYVVRERELTLVPIGGSGPRVLLVDKWQFVLWNAAIGAVEAQGKRQDAPALPPLPDAHALPEDLSAALAAAHPGRVVDAVLDGDRLATCSADGCLRVWSVSAQVRGGGGGTRTHTPSPERDFESRASTDSATPPTPSE